MNGHDLATSMASPSTASLIPPELGQSVNGKGSLVARNVALLHSDSQVGKLSQRLESATQDTIQNFSQLSESSSSETKPVNSQKKLGSKKTKVISNTLQKSVGDEAKLKETAQVSKETAQASEETDKGTEGLVEGMSNLFSKMAQSVRESSTSASECEAKLKDLDSLKQGCAKVHTEIQTLMLHIVNSHTEKFSSFIEGEGFKFAEPFQLFAVTILRSHMETIEKKRASTGKKDVQFNERDQQEVSQKIGQDIRSKITTQSGQPISNQAFEVIQAFIKQQVIEAFVLLNALILELTQKEKLEHAEKSTIVVFNKTLHPEESGESMQAPLPALSELAVSTEILSSQQEIDAYVQKKIQERRQEEKEIDRAQLNADIKRHDIVKREIKDKGIKQDTLHRDTVKEEINQRMKQLKNEEISLKTSFYCNKALLASA